jgi:hypothetical protein
MNEERLKLARLLLPRLERISADSVWAHRASGIRGTLIRMMEKIERGIPAKSSELRRMNDLINAGFAILKEAARERLSGRTH